jgi:hypothetical protein
LVGKNSFAPPFNGWEYQDCHTDIPGNFSMIFQGSFPTGAKKNGALPSTLCLEMTPLSFSSFQHAIVPKFMISNR